MKRTLYSELLTWKKRPNRKPLIVKGARQTGKTWLMKEFGRQEYGETAYINFERNPNLAAIFQEAMDIDGVIQALQVESGVRIVPERTLLIFDEIQEAPQAIAALKYFCEEAPGYHIVAAGSLLGIALHRSVSFPVGKVEFLNMHPLSFHEFLMAMEENELLDLLASGRWNLLRVFHKRLTDRLRQYYLVGGMPEAVAEFAASGDVHEVRRIQKNILNAYELDFSKHAPAKEIPRIRMVWNSIPGQLAREKRKFIYSHIKEGSRAKDFEKALAWLVDCGQVLKVKRVTKPGLPLKSYADFTAFKLFLVDTGLLCAMTEVPPRVILEGNDIFTEFKGALTEQFACQQILTLSRHPVGYWSADRGTSEVDFLIQSETSVIPVEVKAEQNLKAKSLKTYYDKFSPPFAIRTSLADFRQEGWLWDIPLYAFVAWLQKEV